MSEKLNIIFDLDETLIQTPDIDLGNNKSNILNFPNIANVGIISSGEMKTITYLRPYLKELLDYCYENFNVGFWTAANYYYCIEVLKIILTEEQYDKTKVILARLDYENIIEIKQNIKYTNENLNILNFKPMELLFNNYSNLNFKIDNTVLIDDNMSVCEYNKFNTIKINKFNRFNINDNALLQLLEWLKNGKYNTKIEFKEDDFVHL